MVTVWRCTVMLPHSSPTRFCYLTCNATVEFNSHGDVTVPRDWMNSEESSIDWSTEFVGDGDVEIVVTLKYLINNKKCFINFQ